MTYTAGFPPEELKARIIGSTAAAPVENRANLQRLLKGTRDEETDEDGNAGQYLVALA